MIVELKDFCFSFFLFLCVEFHCHAYKKVQMISTAIKLNLFLFLFLFLFSHFYWNWNFRNWWCFLYDVVGTWKNTWFTFAYYNVSIDRMFVARNVSFSSFICIFSIACTQFSPKQLIANTWKTQKYQQQKIIFLNRKLHNTTWNWFKYYLRL